jgi:hypothetical protein
MELEIYKETEFSGKIIRQRNKDGYLNATDMCKANNKLYADWKRLENTHAYLNELSCDMGYPISTLIEIIKGGKSNKQGTWVHPYVATNLAQWLSPKFAVFVSKLVFRYLNGDLSLIDEIKNNNQLLQKQLEEQKYQLEEKTQQLEDKEQQMNRLHIIQKELLSYKKRVLKEETVYIVSTANYARQGIYKIGRTKSQMKFRSSSHNTTHISGDKVKVLKEFKVNDSVLVERTIHTKLSGLLLDGEKEFFMCPYDLLYNLVDLVVNHDDGENEYINKIIDTVFRLKQSAFNSTDWTNGLPEDIFKETFELKQDNQKLIEFNVSDWTNSHKKEFIVKCIEEYIKQQNKVNQEFQIVWKIFQSFLINQLNISKTRFKVADWKYSTKEVIKEKEKLTIKWRS